MPQLENPVIADKVKDGIVDDMSLQKYLMATSLLKDSIQDSLNMIVSDDGKLNDAAMRRQLDTKFPSIMDKSIPINTIFKDQAKFDTQNPIISSLLTQIEIRKKQKEKDVLKKLATAPSMKDLTIAEHLQRLSQFNRNRPAVATTTMMKAMEDRLHQLNYNRHYLFTTFLIDFSVYHCPMTTTTIMKMILLLHWHPLKN